jgi:hypothetical protein
LVFAGQWSSGRLGSKIGLGLAEAAATEPSARRLGAKSSARRLEAASRADKVSDAAEASAAKLGTTGPHCAAHNHLTTVNASVGVGRGLAEPAAADEVSARRLGAAEAHGCSAIPRVMMILLDLAFLVDQLASNRPSCHLRIRVCHGGNCS